MDLEDIPSILRLSFDYLLLALILLIIVDSLILDVNSDLLLYLSLAVLAVGCAGHLPRIVKGPSSGSRGGGL